MSNEEWQEVYRLLHQLSPEDLKTFNDFLRELRDSEDNPQPVFFYALTTEASKK